MIYYSYYDSPLGNIILESDGQALNGLYFAEKDHISKFDNDLAIFKLSHKWLDLYFKGQRPNFMPEIVLNASPFAKEVWDIVKTIPYGKTMTYGEIADMMAAKRGINKMSARAVGVAVGKNPIAIMIPCHRVIGKNQRPVGYAFGIDRKLALLKIEGIELK